MQALTNAAVEINSSVTINTTRPQQTRREARRIADEVNVTLKFEDFTFRKVIQDRLDCEITGEVDVIVGLDRNDGFAGIIGIGEVRVSEMRSYHNGKAFRFTKPIQDAIVAALRESTIANDPRFVGMAVDWIDDHFDCDGNIADEIVDMWKPVSATVNVVSVDGVFCFEPVK